MPTVFAFRIYVHISKSGQEIPNMLPYKFGVKSFGLPATPLMMADEQQYKVQARHILFERIPILLLCFG